MKRCSLYNKQESKRYHQGYIRQQTTLTLPPFFVQRLLGLEWGMILQVSNVIFPDEKFRRQVSIFQ